jgi:ABC-type glycerol-3-phosphate transport system permease component
MVRSKTIVLTVLVFSILNLIAHAVYGLAMQRVMTFFFFMWLGIFIPLILTLITIVYMAYKRVSNINLWGIVLVNGVMVVAFCYYLEKALSRH